MSDTLSQSARQMMLDRVNAEFGYSFTLDDLEFGTPLLVDPTVLDLSDPVRRNTNIQVKARASTNVPFETTVRYNRLHLTRLTQHLPVELADEGQATSLDLLSTLNGQMGIVLGPDDIDPLSVTDMGDGTRTVTFRASSTSLTVLGEVEFRLISAELIPVDEVNVALSAAFIDSSSMIVGEPESPNGSFNVSSTPSISLAMRVMKDVKQPVPCDTFSHYDIPALTDAGWRVQMLMKTASGRVVTDVARVVYRIEEYRGAEPNALLAEYELRPVPWDPSIFEFNVLQGGNGNVPAVHTSIDKTLVYFRGNSELPTSSLLDSNGNAMGNLIFTLTAYDKIVTTRKLASTTVRATISRETEHGPYDRLFPTGYVPDMSKVFKPLVSIPVPVKAKSIYKPSYVDPAFGTPQFLAVAITDTMHANSSRLRHEYSRRTAWNCDGSLYAWQNSAGYTFISQTKDFERINAGRTVSGTGMFAVGDGAGKHMREPCDWTWDRTKPDELIFGERYGDGFTFWRFNVRTHAISLEFDIESKIKALFPTATGITTGGEGRPSADNRYWGFKVFRKNPDAPTNPDADFTLGLAVYDSVNDVITGHLVTNTNPNNVTMSTLGNYIIATNYNTTYTFDQCKTFASSEYKGTRAWTRNFSSWQQLHCSSQHADPAIDQDGDECYVTCTYEGSRMPIESGWVYSVKLHNGVMTPLVRNYDGNKFGAHYSTTMAPTRSGVFLWSTYHNIRRGNTSYKDGIIALVEIAKNPRVIVLCHHRTERTTYYDEPHAMMSPDGWLVGYSCTFDNSDEVPLGAYGRPMLHVMPVHSSVYKQFVPIPPKTNHMRNGGFDNGLTEYSVVSGTGASVVDGKLRVVGTTNHTIGQTLVGMAAGATFTFGYDLARIAAGNVTVRIRYTDGTYLAGITRDNAGLEVTDVFTLDPAKTPDRIEWRITTETINGSPQIDLDIDNAFIHYP